MHIENEHFLICYIGGNKQWTDLTATAADSKEVILAHAKCIKQPVLNVSKNAKYHSSLLKESLFSAENVTRKEKVTSFLIQSNTSTIDSFFYLIFYRNLTNSPAPSPGYTFLFAPGKA